MDFLLQWFRMVPEEMILFTDSDRMGDVSECSIPYLTGGIITRSDFVVDNRLKILL